MKGAPLMVTDQRLWMGLRAWHTGLPLSSHLVQTWNFLRESRMLRLALQTSPDGICSHDLAASLNALIVIKTQHALVASRPHPSLLGEALSFRPPGQPARPQGACTYPEAAVAGLPRVLAAGVCPGSCLCALGPRRTRCLQPPRGGRPRLSSGCSALSWGVSSLGQPGTPSPLSRT